MVSVKHTRSYLVVDQAATVTRRVRTQLQRAGAPRDRILEAFTAERAEAMFRRGHPDMCLVGLELPDASGLELAEDLWALDPSASVVVMAAASPQDPRVRAALEAGAQGVLQKPVRWGELRRLLTEEASPSGLARIPPAEPNPRSAP